MYIYVYLYTCCVSESSTFSIQLDYAQTCPRNL